jgi:hypothetical protein
LNLTPGMTLTAYDDGGYYGDADIVFNGPAFLLVVFRDFAANRGWRARLATVPKTALHDDGRHAHFFIEDCAATSWLGSDSSLEIREAQKKDG